MMNDELIEIRARVEPKTGVYGQPGYAIFVGDHCITMGRKSAMEDICYQINRAFDAKAEALQAAGYRVVPIYRVADCVPELETPCFYFFKPFENEKGHWHQGRYFGKDECNQHCFGGRAGWNCGHEVTHWSPILPDPINAAGGEHERDW